MAAVNAYTYNYVASALGDELAAKNLFAPCQNIAGLTLGATTGSYPTTDGVVAISNTGTPTVVELLAFCTEINAKLDALRTQLS